MRGTFICFFHAIFLSDMKYDHLLDVGNLFYVVLACPLNMYVKTIRALSTSIMLVEMTLRLFTIQQPVCCCIARNVILLKHVPDSFSWRMFITYIIERNYFYKVRISVEIFPGDK